MSIPSATTPKRIVCLVPSITEYLFDLELDDEVVGITKFCIHPSQWFRTKKRIGGTKNINTNVILNLKPDLVIANIEENVKEQVEELAQTVPVLVTDVKSIDDALKTLLEIGKLVDKEKKAKSIVDSIKKNFDQMPKASKPIDVAYIIWQKPYMVVGGDTFISSLLTQCGFKNKFKKENRYPTIETEQLMGCDAVLLSSEPYPFKDKHVKSLQAELDSNNVIIADGEMFSWYGSRLLKATDYFAKFIVEIETMCQENKERSTISE